MLDLMSINYKEFVVKWIEYHAVSTQQTKSYFYFNYIDIENKKRIVSEFINYLKTCISHI